MPFKSKAQRRKFFAMERNGEIPKGTTARFNRHTSGPLPERSRRSVNVRPKRRKVHNPPVTGNFLSRTGEKSDRIAW